MTSLPTASFTFNDLVLAVAVEMGVAYYGADGTEAAQVPTSAHDLAECKRHVNNAIRMFILNAPPGDGWWWTRPLASVVGWPSVAITSGITVSGGAFSGGITTLTASSAVFHESMERKSIVITGVGTFTMGTYTSSTVMTVSGDASTASGATFSITADGNYTIKRDFGGVFQGKITYAADTNSGTHIDWTSEDVIRAAREDNTSNGFPRLAAIRAQPPVTDIRRWSLLLYPTPSSAVTLQFPYSLYFQRLATLTGRPPTPMTMDDAVRAACLMVVERDVHRTAGVHTDYYQKIALPSAWERNARATPRRLGRMQAPTTNVLTPQNFRDFRSLPTIDTSSL